MLSLLLLTQTSNKQSNTYYVQHGHQTCLHSKIGLESRQLMNICVLNLFLGLRLNLVVSATLRAYRKMRQYKHTQKKTELLPLVESASLRKKQ